MGEGRPEGVELLGEALEVRVTLLGRRKGVRFVANLGEAGLQAATPGLQFLQRQSAHSIRVDQALDLTAQLRCAPLERLTVLCLRAVLQPAMPGPARSSTRGGPGHSAGN